jgi:hypothetical protein
MFSYLICSRCIFLFCCNCPIYKYCLYSLFHRIVYYEVYNSDYYNCVNLTWCIWEFGMLCWILIIYDFTWNSIVLIQMENNLFIWKINNKINFTKLRLLLYHSILYWVFWHAWHFFNIFIILRVWPLTFITLRHTAKHEIVIHRPTLSPIAVCPKAASLEHTFAQVQQLNHIY